MNLLNPNFDLNYELHKKEKPYMYIESKVLKDRKSIKIAGHSENEIIPKKMRTSEKMKKSPETKINENTNLGVS